MRFAVKMLKTLDIVRLSWMTSLFSHMLKSRTVPLEWHTGVVVSIFKKGGSKVCAPIIYYLTTAITLLSPPGIVYSRVLDVPNNG